MDANANNFVLWNGPVVQVRFDEIIKIAFFGY